MSAFGRALRRIIRLYKTTKMRRVIRQFESFGKNSVIDMPMITVHPERIAIGDDVQILKDSRLCVYLDNSKIDAHISIGDRCILNCRDTIMAGADIRIGNDVIIASDCCILSEDHGFNPESEIPYYDQILISKETTIDDGCWLGHGVIVLAGVHIGKKCVIGGGAVVTKDIPDYSMAVGNPARVIKRYNFTEHRWEKEGI